MAREELMSKDDEKAAKEKAAREREEATRRKLAQLEQAVVKGLEVIDIFDPAKKPKK